MQGIHLSRLSEYLIKVGPAGPTLMLMGVAGFKNRKDRSVGINWASHRLISTSLNCPDGRVRCVFNKGLMDWLEAG